MPRRGRGPSRTSASTATSTEQPLDRPRGPQGHHDGLWSGTLPMIKNKKTVRVARDSVGVTPSRGSERTRRRVDATQSSQRRSTPRTTRRRLPARDGHGSGHREFKSIPASVPPAFAPRPSATAVIICRSDAPRLCQSVLSLLRRHMPRRIADSEVGLVQQLEATLLAEAPLLKACSC